MTATAAPRVMKRRIAYGVTAMRTELGWSQGYAAQHMDCSEGRIANLEGERNWPKPEFLEKLLRVYGHEDEIPEYLAMLKAGKGAQPEWHHLDLTADPVGFDDYLGLEIGASKIEVYEPRLIPGILQTRDYAWHVIRGRQHSNTDLDAKVELRMRRQEVLTRQRSPAHLWAFIEEDVLDLPVDSPGVMLAQYTRLLDLMRLDNVQIQVCPRSLGPHLGRSGPPFTVLHFPIPHDPGLVSVETRVKTIWFDKQAEIDQHTDVLDHLRTLALRPDTSFSLISERIEQTSKEVS